MSHRMIYLDYAAATPMSDGVIKAMEPYFSKDFYNPSAMYLPARKVKQDIEEAKKSIASLIGARSGEIIHTSGGTESNNLAVNGVMERFSGKKLLVSAVEHESLLKPSEKYPSRSIPVDKHGIIRLDSLEQAIDDDVVLISTMLVNNETGSLQPIKEIADIVAKVNRSRRKNDVDLPLYLHTDACQAPCYVDIHAKRLGVDLMTLNGGKIYGPKQSGILFVRTGVDLEPQLLGGGHQHGLRSGTESPASVVGFARAIETASQARKDERARVSKLRQAFIDGLEKISPSAVINGHPKKHSPHILSVSFPGADNEKLLFQLENEGVLAASGSACSASTAEPSHVLEAMGLSVSESRSTIRFSFGKHTTKSDIDELVKILEKLV